jgi:hypothetical protein
VLLGIFSQQHIANRQRVQHPLPQLLIKSQQLANHRFLKIVNESFEIEGRIIFVVLLQNDEMLVIELFETHFELVYLRRNELVNFWGAALPFFLDLDFFEKGEGCLHLRCLADPLGAYQKSEIVPKDPAVDGRRIEESQHEVGELWVVMHLKSQAVLLDLLYIESQSCLVCYQTLSFYG